MLGQVRSIVCLPKAILMALAAMLVWASMAVAIMFLRDIPTLEILSLTSLLGCFVTLLQLSFSMRWHAMQSSVAMLLVGTFAITGTACLYISALKLAPPAHIELLMYIWPILVVAGNILLGQEQLTYKKSLALILAITAVIILNLENLDANEFIADYYLGYMLVFCAAISWSAYNIFSRRQKSASPELMGVYAGIGGVILCCVHFLCEETVIPTLPQAILITVIGVLSKGFAYQFWDFALKNVAPIIMAVISYMTPVVALLLLLYFGFTSFSILLLLSFIFLFIALLLLL